METTGQGSPERLKLSEVMGVKAGLLLCFARAMIGGDRRIMQNKDLLWVRPDFLSGVEEPARAGKRKSPKSEPFVDDGRETFTVAEIASLWKLSRDTIQRLFEDEPGVIALGEKHPRGKRKRVTLRIPRAVMLRVKKQRSNS